MKVTKEHKKYIEEWLKYADGVYNRENHKLTKAIHCPIIVNNIRCSIIVNNIRQNTNNTYCRVCRNAFRVFTGCPCKMLGVRAVEKRAREVLKLEEI